MYQLENNWNDTVRTSSFQKAAMDWPSIIKKNFNFVHSRYSLHNLFFNFNYTYYTRLNHFYLLNDISVFRHAHYRAFYYNPTPLSCLQESRMKANDSFLD